MDIKFKKTTLDDDALMYNKSKDTITKEELKNLPFKQKLIYFKDYFAKRTIVVIIIIAVLISILNTTVFNRATCQLSLILINGQLEEAEALSDSLEEYLEITNKNDYVSTETFNISDYQMNMAFMTRIWAASTDILICSRTDFEEQAARGYCADLSETLPEELYASLADRIVEGQVEELDEDGNVISRSDPTPFGIDISDSSILEEYELYCPDPVLCITANSPNLENALKTISYFVD